MGVYIYYIKAINDCGEEIFVKLSCHHGRIDSIDEMTEEEMREEIKEELAEG